MQQEGDYKFLDFVVKSLVEHPEEVKITRTIDEMGVLLTLTVNKDDMGKVIGRSGATAKAIRTILRVVGMKNDARVNLKIEEPEGGAHSAATEEASGPSTPYVRDTTVDDVIADLKGE